MVSRRARTVSLDEPFRIPRGLHQMESVKVPIGEKDSKLLLFQPQAEMRIEHRRKSASLLWVLGKAPRRPEAEENHRRGLGRKCSAPFRVLCPKNASRVIVRQVVGFWVGAIQTKSIFRPPSRRIAGCLNCNRILRRNKYAVLHLRAKVQRPGHRPYRFSNEFAFASNASYFSVMWR